MERMTPGYYLGHLREAQFGVAGNERKLKVFLTFDVKSQAVQDGAGGMMWQPIVPVVKRVEWWAHTEKTLPMVIDRLVRLGADRRALEEGEIALPSAAFETGMTLACDHEADQKDPAKIYERWEIYAEQKVEAVGDQERSALKAKIRHHLRQTQAPASAPPAAPGAAPAAAPAPGPAAASPAASTPQTAAQSPAAPHASAVPPPPAAAPAAVPPQGGESAVSDPLPF